MRRNVTIVAASAAFGVCVAWGGMWCLLAFGPETLLNGGAVT